MLHSFVVLNMQEYSACKADPLSSCGHLSPDAQLSCSEVHVCLHVLPVPERVPGPYPVTAFVPSTPIRPLLLILLSGTFSEAFECRSELQHILALDGAPLGPPATAPVQQHSSSSSA